jgi:hypothetical protein
MDVATLLIIAATVVIHLIGIGLFLVWFAAGRPMSVEALRRWWKEVEFLPPWLRRRKKGLG